MLEALIFVEVLLSTADDADIAVVEGYDLIQEDPARVCASHKVHVRVRVHVYVHVYVYVYVHVHVHVRV